MIHDPFAMDMANTKKFAEMNRFEHGDKYTGLTALQATGILSPREEHEQLDEVYRLLTGVDPAFTKKNWETLEKRLTNNLGLVQFMLDYGAKSEFFVPWLLSIPKAICLEVAFGFGYDTQGYWRMVPKKDPFYWWIVREGMFVYLRKRAVKTAEIIEQHHYSRGKARVLFLGAGFLPEIRHTGFEAKDDQEFVAFDKDSSIANSGLIGDVKNLLYFNEDLNVALLDSDYIKYFDVVVMNGVMSYCYDKMSIIIKRAISLLKPNGVLIFDVQLAHWNIVRDAVVFDWKTEPPMYLAPSAYDVVSIAEMATRNLPVSVSSKTYDQGVIVQVIRH